MFASLRANVMFCKCLIMRFRFCGNSIDVIFIVKFFILIHSLNKYLFICLVVNALFLCGYNIYFHFQKWNKYDLSNHPSKRSNLTCGKNVSR